MTKEKLRQYIWLKEDLERTKWQIKDLDQEILRSISSDGQPKGKNQISRPVEAAAQSREKILAHYDSQIKQLEKMILEIESDIAKLPSRERTIIRELYFAGKTQSQIAEEKNYSVRQISRIHKKAIEILESGD